MIFGDYLIVDIISKKELFLGVNKSDLWHHNLANSGFPLLNHSSRFSSINDLFFNALKDFLYRTWTIW